MSDIQLFVYGFLFLCVFKVYVEGLKRERDVCLSSLEDKKLLAPGFLVT